MPAQPTSWEAGGIGCAVPQGGPCLTACLAPAALQILDGIGSPAIELSNGCVSTLYMLVHTADQETVDW